MEVQGCQGSQGIFIYYLQPFELFRVSYLEQTIFLIKFASIQGSIPWDAVDFVAILDAGKAAVAGQA